LRTLVFPSGGTSFRVADDLGNGGFPFRLLALRAGGGGLFLPLPSRVMRWPMILNEIDVPRLVWLLADDPSRWAPRIG